MGELVVVGLAGLLASLVDGALGMGFGPTSSTILLSGGLSPAAVSTTVNIAKVATGAAGGIAHWRFGNIDRRLVLKLALPGALGAIVGATVLANVDGQKLRPWLAALLILVGLRILVRFWQMTPTARADPGGAVTVPDASGVALVAATGGVTNGLIGAWGPVVTPFLLHRGVTPRVAIGSVNTAEVAVAACAAGSLFASLGGGGIDPSVVGAMLIGGVIGAPIAAWLVRFLPPRNMGLAVAGLLLITNIRELAGWAGVGPGRWAGYSTVFLAIVIAMIEPGVRQVSSDQPAPAEPPGLAVGS